jgi:hypothetical protein
MDNQNSNQGNLNSQQQDQGKIANVLWIAFMASVASFFVVLTLIVTDAEPLSIDPEVMIFGFLAVTNAALSFVLPKMMNPKPQASEYAVAPRPVGFGPKDFTPFVVRLALSESVGVFGLVLGILKQYIEVSAPFFVVSFFCVLMAKPKTLVPGGSAHESL